MFDLSFTTPSSSSATSQSGVSGSNPALPSETRISKVTFLFSSIITWPFRDSRLARHIKRSVSPGSNYLNAFLHRAARIIGCQSIIKLLRDGQTESKRVAAGSNCRPAQRGQVHAV